MKCALTVAGSDPCGGAGIQADLKVFHREGVHGLSVITCITAQNTTGVAYVEEVTEAAFRSQLEVLLADIKPDALKTGILSSPAQVKVLCDAIKAHALKRVVVDPVTVSSSGRPLVREETAEAIKRLLLPLTTVFTPNIPEVELFTGMKMQIPTQSHTQSNACDKAQNLKQNLNHMPLTTVFTPNIPEVELFTGMKMQIPTQSHTQSNACDKAQNLKQNLNQIVNTMNEAAQRLLDSGPEYVVIKGGHLKDKAIDVVVSGNGIIDILESPMYEGSYHGTGCVFSAAITAALAKGSDVSEAIRMAKNFIETAIINSCNPGGGMRILGI